MAPAPPAPTARRIGRRSRPGAQRPRRCPTDLLNCKVASGRIIYVERVDPDGDGDAHFVLASSDSITAPGISVIDVRRSLGPARFRAPVIVSAPQSPVREGSYGQRESRPWWC